MVARYNSCGAPTEIGRRAYTTRARLYPNGPWQEIKWFVARDDVPFKRGPNCISSNQWQADRPDEFDQVEVGEDPEWPRVFEYNPVNPLAIGGHVCGTAEDWAGDGVYDPEPPYVEYRPDGLPFCCGALFAGEGGLVLGGEAYLASPKVGTGGLVLGGEAYLASPKVGTGGLVLGGTAVVDWPRGYRAGFGGLVIGGSAVVDWPGGYRAGFGGLVIGGSAVVEARPLPTTCGSAWVLPINTGPPFELLESVGDYWFYFGSWPGGSHMHVEFPGVGLYDVTFAVMAGMSCAALVGLPFSSPHPGCYEFFVPTPLDLWLRITVRDDVPVGYAPLPATGPCMPPPP